MTRQSTARSTRPAVATWLLIVFIMPALGAPCAAQRALPPARPMPIRPSFRLDALFDRDAGAQAAIGAAIPAAYNLRIGLDAGAGGVNRPAGWAAAGRADLLARWLSDPFRQSRWGLSAGAGIGQRVEADRRPSTVAIITLGLDGPSDGRWVRGVEVGLGGGVRAGLTLRGAPLRQR